MVSKFMDNRKNDRYYIEKVFENISRISKEFRERHSNIKWGEIIGFRNGIVHDYGKTDYSIVYEIVSGDIHKLRSDLEEIMVNNWF